jgi:hypothetical protein
MLSVIYVEFTSFVHNDECLYAECRYGECPSTIFKCFERMCNNELCIMDDYKTL